MKICVFIFFLFHDFRKKIEEKNGKKETIRLINLLFQLLQTFISSDNNSESFWMEKIKQMWIAL
jgi:hypothetical protein